MMVRISKGEEGLERERGGVGQWPEMEQRLKYVLREKGNGQW